MKKTKNIFLGLMLCILATINAFGAKPSSLPDSKIDYPEGVMNLFFENKVDSAEILIDKAKKRYSKKVSAISILTMEAAIYFEALKMPTLTEETKNRIEAKKETLVKKMKETKSELMASFLLSNGLIKLESNNDTIEYITSCLQYQTEEEIDKKFDTTDSEEKSLAVFTKDDHAVLLIILAKAQYNAGKKDEACKNLKIASKLFMQDFVRRDVSAMAEQICPPETLENTKNKESTEN
ncbi:MAG: hypothetical protein LBU04_07685 [Christensenellaceae bacterium]|jgi:hypothetical protein|nr:hypothetical protein [Christensenellaceae bacterium]